MSAPAASNVSSAAKAAIEAAMLAAQQAGDDFDEKDGWGFDEATGVAKPLFVSRPMKRRVDFSFSNSEKYEHF